jgi:hypothetical protein
MEITKSKLAEPTRLCGECGDSLNNCQKKYCSHACKNKALGKLKAKTKPIFKCKNCETEFTLLPSEAKRGRGTFCSRKCSGEWRKNNPDTEKYWTIRVCENCDKTFVVSNSSIRKGSSTGRFCSMSCTHEFRRNVEGFFGKNKPHSKPGSFKTPDGYLNIYDPGRGKTVKEHRIVVEKHLGRKLNTWERIHHKNGIRDDNNIENLEIVINAHFSGVRLKDVYPKDIERLIIENYHLKQELERLKYSQIIAAYG